MGGRGSSSWKSVGNKRYSKILSRAGITEEMYENNKKDANVLYIMLNGNVADAYEKATGNYGEINQSQFDKYIAKYDFTRNLTSVEKDYINRIKSNTEKQKVELAKDIAKKLGFSPANYKEFLKPTYIDGYSKTQGKPYTIKQLKRRLKSIKD